MNHVRVSETMQDRFHHLHFNLLELRQNISMELNTVSAISLLYCYVDVRTHIERSHGYKSTFCNRIPNLPNEQEKNLIYTGFLKAFDPLTKSVILCNIEESTLTDNILILGRHIVSIAKSSIETPKFTRDEVQSVINSATSLSSAEYPYLQCSNLDETELSEKCDKIVEWLKKNRIPVERRGNNIVVAENVKIKPPYEHATDYICPTRTILERLKRIVESRPT